MALRGLPILQITYSELCFSEQKEKKQVCLRLKQSESLGYSLTYFTCGSNNSSTEMSALRRLAALSRRGVVIFESR